MFRFLRRLFGPRLRPMNIIKISKNNILDNYDLLAWLQSHAKMFPVLKSNAYGHGLREVVKILNKTDAEYIVVDSFPEYQIVKTYSNKPILVLWETLDENYKYFDLKRTTFCVYNIQTLEYLADRWKELEIHIFVNTWMNREWIDEVYLKDFLKVLEANPQIKVTGVMSHLHSADEMYYDYIDVQITNFKKLYMEIINHGHTPCWRHIWNTAGMLKINDEFFNAYRPGLWIYGYNPLRSDDKSYLLGKKLRPALTIISRVVWIHDLLPGDGASYSHTWKASEKERIAVLPFGYAEWLDRKASNKIMFKSGKKYFRQVGNVCMNLSTCLVDNSCKLWDEIEIISYDKDCKNSMYVLADASGTIVYENLVRIDKWIRRIVD